MNRRTFLTALAGTAGAAMLPSFSARAQVPTFLNGELNLSLGTFDWTNGGGDPLWQVWQANGFARSFAISRLNLSASTQQGLHQTLLQAPFAHVDLATLFEGRVVGDVMLSGNGWIALRPRLVSSQWRAGRSTMASWWVWTDPVTRERWEMYVPVVCGNLVLTRLGQAVPCVCDPAVDACIVR